MYKCSKCNKDKSRECFYNREDGRPHSWCRDCNKAYQREHYHLTKDRYREARLINNRKRRKEVSEYMHEYKLEKGCKSCGYNKCYAALDFHHPNKDKEHNISTMGTNSLKKVKEEIKKCIVLCANCHRELHHNEGY